MTKVKAMRNKILAEMIDDPGEEITTAGGIILLLSLIHISEPTRPY